MITPETKQALDEAAQKRKVEREYMRQEEARIESEIKASPTKACRECIYTCKQPPNITVLACPRRKIK